MMRLTMKNLLGSSSGMTRNSADFSLQKVSASTAVSKHSSCSISLSRKALSRARVVDITEAMAWSAVEVAAPANHFALCVSGNRESSTWNWVWPLVWLGAISSWMILNTDTMCRSGGGQNSRSEEHTSEL